MNLDRKCIDTDQIKLVRSLRATLMERIQVVGDCHLYEPEEETRHIKVEIYGKDAHGQERTAIASVRRVAYALAHPLDHVRKDEDVVVVCGHAGDGPTGRGCCLRPEHLLKVPMHMGQQILASMPLTQQQAAA